MSRVIGSEKQRYLQEPNGEPRCSEVDIDGVKIPAISMVDGLCLLYSINLDQIPRQLEAQTNYLSRHLEQLSDWIMLLEKNPTYLPTALTISWKRDRQRAKIADCIWSVSDRSPESQSKDGDAPTRFRLKEPVHVSTGREWGSVEESRVLGLRQLCRDQYVVSAPPMEEGSFNKNTHNFNSDKTINASMPQLSDDSGSQYDLPELLFSLKDKYSFRDETNKNILYDDEIKRFAKLYCITNFCLVLSCDDSIFWLEDSDSVIYIWSRIDCMMMRAGCDMKEALLNFLFHGENLCYVEDYTLNLIPVLKLKEEADKWIKENRDTLTTIVVIDESLKPLEEKKEESNKGGKRKKRQRRKNKH